MPPRRTPKLAIHVTKRDVAPAPAKLFDWTAVYSESFPHTHLLQRLEIIHPNGDRQVLFGEPPKGQD